MFIVRQAGEHRCLMVNIVGLDRKGKVQTELVTKTPTDDLEVAPPRCCCNATAGGRPSMLSTCGARIWSNNRRAYGATDSR